jgi:hypothetical protein
LKECLNKVITFKGELILTWGEELLLDEKNFIGLIIGYFVDKLLGSNLLAFWMGWRFKFL